MSGSPSFAESPAGPPAGLSAVAARVFGDRLPVAEAYAAMLATAGVERGLIGPRETSRLWDRHLLNCAVLGELIAADEAVIDVGSGAGLPGIVLAILRPGTPVTLVESMARRVAFLDEVVGRLGLDRVTVVRGRAEELAGRIAATVVTARAVAPLDRLARWCLPLCGPGGRLLAMKGTSVAEEIAEHAGSVSRSGGGLPRIVECGRGIVDPPATVVEIPLLGAPRIRPRDGAERRPASSRPRSRSATSPPRDRRRRGHRDR